MLLSIFIFSEGFCFLAFSWIQKAGCFSSLHNPQSAFTYEYGNDPIGFSSSQSFIPQQRWEPVETEKVSDLRGATQNWAPILYHIAKGNIHLISRLCPSFRDNTKTFHSHNLSLSLSPVDIFTDTYFSHKCIAYLL